MDAADSKGEPIHQTLMAKKMQRLDESPDFRPFKFRIAAFTNAFLEEVDIIISGLYASLHPFCLQLARQGFPEEKIPMKKVINKDKRRFRDVHYVSDPELSLEASIHSSV